VLDCNDCVSIQVDRTSGINQGFADWGLYAHCVMGVSVCAGLMVTENTLSAFSAAHIDLDHPRKPHLGSTIPALRDDDGTLNFLFDAMHGVECTSL
jgi:hypothetical protein